MLPASGELGGGSCNEVTTELTAKGVDDTDDEDTDDVWQGMMMTSRIMVRTMDNGQVSYDYGQWLILPEIQNQKERFIWAVDDINLMLLL